MRKTSKTITLEDGTSLTLTLDFNAAADFEEVTNHSFFNAPNTASVTRARIWAMARQTNEDLTQRDVGRLMVPGGTDFNAIMTAITELSGATESEAVGKGSKVGKVQPASGS